MIDLIMYYKGIVEEYIRAIAENATFFMIKIWFYFNNQNR